MNGFRKSQMGVFGAMCLAVLAGGASARAADWQMNTVTVDVAGLDLRSQAGEAVLRHRIAVAARQVCSASDAEGFSGIADRDRCLREARSDAMAQATRMIAAAQGRGTYAVAALVP